MKGITENEFEQEKCMFKIYETVKSHQKRGK